jgi:hypothetical protein
MIMRGTLCVGFIENNVYNVVSFKKPQYQNTKMLKSFYFASLIKYGLKYSLSIFFYRINIFPQ